jgi:ubiquinone/menaquinone biosynthesis C-methylase UbiE
MKIENKDFWEREDIIYSQDKTVADTSNYEAYLYEKTKEYFKKMNLSIKKAKIFGCGTGREINGILKYLSIDSILATDISENMIKKGNENIVAWNLQDKVFLEVADATKFKSKESSYELVTLMNCMLTYIKDKEDRYTIFKTANDILASEGVIIGVVHNQVGTPQKTFYFALRRFFKPFLKDEPGNRITGFNGFKFGAYYFTKNDLSKHLLDSGFKNIEIKSLADYYKELNIEYNRFKGYNNLILFATKS